MNHNAFNSIHTPAEAQSPADPSASTEVTTTDTPPATEQPEASAFTGMVTVGTVAEQTNGDGGPWPDYSGDGRLE